MEHSLINTDDLSERERDFLISTLKYTKSELRDEPNIDNSGPILMAEIIIAKLQRRMYGN
jgi:hypothetical protein